MTTTDLDNWFSFHAASADQADKYTIIRSAARVFAQVIFEECPDSPDRTVAIRKLREAVMVANASIACEGR